MDIKKRLKGEQMAVFRQYFVYTTEVMILPATIGATVTSTVNILADANFECNYITGIIKQAGKLIADWGGLIQINDSALGKTFFNVATPFDSIAGDARQPYPLNPPRMIKARASLVITVTNSVATESHVILSFHGNKLYPGEAPVRASNIRD